MDDGFNDTDLRKSDGVFIDVKSRARIAEGIIAIALYAPVFTLRKKALNARSTRVATFCKT